MIFKVLDNDYYLIKMPKTDIKNIYNKNKITELIKKIVKDILQKYKLKGLIYLDIYINGLYGIIVSVTNKDIVFFDNEVEVKMTFHINTTFLYLIDYFDLMKLNIKNQKIYYYKDNFYLEIVNKISNNKYLKLLEYSDIVYEDILEILNKGLKIGI